MAVVRPLPVALLAVVGLTACGGSDGSDGNTGDTSDLQEHFDLTVSGPAFDTEQHFRVDPERLSWNLGSDSSVVISFLAQGDAIVSEQGSFVLETFNGGVGPDVIDGPGTYPLGPTPTGSDGFSLIIWPSGCPENYVGCDRVNLSTEEGTMEISAFELGEGISRPDEEGPTILTATFAADAEEQDPPNEGRAFQVEGQLHLVDGG